MGGLALLHCRARPIRIISNLSAQTVAQQAMGCQYGVWMGAAKADEARRRVRTSAIAPPCVPLKGGATIICATPEGRAFFERATESLGNRLSVDTRSLLGVLLVNVHAPSPTRTSTMTLLVY